MSGRLYRRSGDSITDRIIGEFNDFAGFDETKPPLCRVMPDSGDVDFDGTPTQQGTVRAARKEKPPASTKTDGGKSQPSERVQTEPLLLCPSCGCSLPEPNHLVSNSMISELRALSRARDKGAAA